MYQGYQTDIDYTYHFYNDWTPSRIQLSALAEGIEPPALQTACELGFGNGVTLNVLASTTRTQWFGTDFNRNHYDFAQSLSDRAGVPTRLFDLSFEAFCDIQDLPHFDLIVLHGIVSWVSEKNLAVLLKFIDQHLAPGGMVFISYNARPGSESFAPTRYLIQQLAHHLPSTHSPQKKLGIIQEWLKQFHQTDPGYLKAFASVETRLAEFDRRDPKYLVHEYLNQHWHNFFFSQMAAKLTPFGLTYLGQSRLSAQHPVLNQSPEQRHFVKDLPATVKQDTIDMMTNNPFRRDLWVRQPRALSSVALNERLHRMQIMLTCMVDSVDLKFQGKRYQVDQNTEESPYRLLIDLLSDYQSHDFTALEQRLGVSPPILLEMLRFLEEQGYLALVTPSLSSQQLAASQCFNRRVIDQAQDQVTVLALPQTASAYEIDRLGRLWLQQRLAGVNDHQVQLDNIFAYYQDNLWPMLMAQKALEM